MFYRIDNMGKGTFGHEAASKAFTRIDPEHDMLIIMTRNAEGRNHGKYWKGFFRTILDGIEQEEGESK